MSLSSQLDPITWTYANLGSVFIVEREGERGRKIVTYVQRPGNSIHRSLPHIYDTLKESTIPRREVDVRVLKPSRYVLTGFIMIIIITIPKRAFIKSSHHVTLNVLDIDVPMQKYKWLENQGVGQRIYSTSTNADTRHLRKTTLASLTMSSRTPEISNDKLLPPPSRWFPSWCNRWMSPTRRKQTLGLEAVHQVRCHSWRSAARYRYA